MWHQRPLPNSLSRGGRPARSWDKPKGGNEDEQEEEEQGENGERENTNTDVSLRTEIVLNQHDKAIINPRWILLDSESTEHVFCNIDLLSDVKTMTNGDVLRLHTSGGFFDTNQRGKFGDIEVWYNKSALANILSLSLITELYRVTMDSEADNAICVHISSGHVIRFSAGRNGLYYFDMANVEMVKIRQAFSFLNTVSENIGLYRKRDIRKATQATLLNRKINHPAKQKFIRVVKDNWIRNIPVTINDVQRAYNIFGPPLPPIKGRTRYRESKKITDTSTIKIPRELFEDLKDVVLCADFHYVNGVAVFHTISRRIEYRTVSFPLNRSRVSMLAELKKVFKLYNARGFRVVKLHGDREFEKIELDIKPVRLQTCGVDEHVPEIERSVQTQKNENRSACHAMPYKCIPRIMVRELVKQGNEFLNAFGSKENSGSGLSPRNMIDDLPHIDYNNLRHEFGEYVQLHTTENFTNGMKSRTIGAIVMGPRNITGQYNFMSLETGSGINGRVVARLPITTNVIERVENLGKDQKQPYKITNMLRYEWRPGMEINGSDDDCEIISEDTIIPTPINQTHGEKENLGPESIDGIQESYKEGDGDTNEVEILGNSKEIDSNQGAIIDTGGHIASVIEVNQGANGDLGDISENTIQEENHGISVGGAQREISSEESNIEPIEENDDSDGEYEHRREEKERRSSYFQVPDESKYGRGKRTRNNKTYSFLQTKIQDLSEMDKKIYFSEAWKDYKTTGKTNMLQRYVTGFIFAQMTARQGIAKYGREAEQKLMAEFMQLLEYKTFHGRKANELTKEQKRRAANMINIIEEKLNRGHTPENPVIRGRSVYNGRRQRGLYTKEQTASPTVSLDAFFITSLIDALERRDVAITDIKGAYLNAKMIHEVFMKIVGKEVDMFCELDPTLKEFVVIENEKKALYVELDKALYGCVQSALLWYETYSKLLKDMGFVLNPYDMCVANSIIEGSQCTICWYVDDNKISHKSSDVVDGIIKKIEERFGPMSRTRGDEHDFLGMSIKHVDGKIKIGIKKHILKALEDFDEDITRNAATPARSYLFETRDAPKLNESKTDNFHSVTALLLFISMRSRIDIQTAVSFLCTRVQHPDEDDWKKLRRVLQYLRGTIDLELTLGADDLKKMQSWVDVSYAVHDDCKSHTGGAISWGVGVLMSKSRKQKLNTKSSTEGEIVGVSDYLPNMIWTKRFLQEQGINIEENILHQDNQSAIKIERNGRRSSGQKTKHIDNRYFWIKDRIETEGIHVKYCSTEKMIADFFTKPLQGSLFRKFRDVIMGIKHITTIIDDGEIASVEERVRKTNSTDIGKTNLPKDNGNRKKNEIGK